MLFLDISKIVLFLDHCEDNSGEVWNYLKAIWRDSALKFCFHGVLCQGNVVKNETESMTTFLRPIEIKVKERFEKKNQVQFIGVALCIFFFFFCSRRVQCRATSLEITDLII